MSTRENIRLIARASLVDLDLCHIISKVIIVTNMCIQRLLHRGSYMRAHVLLNVLNELGKSDKYEACRAFYPFFATSLIN